jgi:hypothetical protein
MNRPKGGRVPHVDLLFHVVLPELAWVTSYILTGTFKHRMNAQYPLKSWQAAGCDREDGDGLSTSVGTWISHGPFLAHPEKAGVNGSGRIRHTFDFGKADRNEIL